MQILFRNISADEENRLPLPPGWVRSSKLINGKSYFVYRNISEGYELDTHPILDKAIRQVKKIPVPQDWTITHQRGSNGESVRTYINMDRKISMTDHPLLRYCIMESLQSMGLPTDSIEFYEPDMIQEENYNIPEDESIDAHYVQDLQNPHSYLEGGIHLGRRFDPFEADYIQHSNDTAPISPLTFAPNTPTTPRNVNYHSDVYDITQPEINSNEFLDQTEDMPQVEAPNVVFKLEYKACIPEQSISDEDINDFINDLGTNISPLTSAGVGSLRQDLSLLNRDVHDLLIELRAQYAQKEKFVPLLVSADSDGKINTEEASEKRNSNSDDNDDDANDLDVVLTNKKIIALASDVVTKLRQQPDYLIWTIANNSAVGNPAMMKAAFLALHRLMHPFSTDPSITTALLLQSINYQLEIFSSNPISKRFKREDRSLVLHCLLVDDLQEALQWNPLQTPLPMVPKVTNETVFSCLLRLYAIRRDCTCYYRTIWKPIWPSILTLLTSTVNRQSSVLYQNVITVADRILEFAFLESSLTSFPTIATSVCRAVTEIGTLETMMSTILYYFLLPNLMKILCADHDSMDNEQSLRAHQVHQFVNKYYDFTWWMRADTATSPVGGNDLQAIDLLRSVLWMVWRLCVVSLYSTEEQVTAMTVDQLNQDRFKTWNTTYLNDDKLRKLLIRSRRRLENAASWLMKLPVDISGTRYLSNDHHVFSIDIQDQDVDATALLEHRIAALQFKPMEMLNLSVISRAELSDLVTDTAYAMEDFQLHEQDGHFYHMIRTYLSYYAQEDPEDAKEELLLLRFLHNNTSAQQPWSKNGGGGVSSEGETALVQEEYRHVSRGLYSLKLYRLALALMIRKVQVQGLSNIHELIGSQLFHLEADLHLAPHSSNDGSGAVSSTRVSLADRHTEGSRQKIRSPHHGLRAERKVKAFPLFAQHNAEKQDLHPNVKSLKAMQDEVIASYRFGSAQPGVDVGSSMARKRVLPPALNQQQVKVTLLNDQDTLDVHSLNNGSVGGHATHRNARKLRQYTTATIRPGTCLLAPTQASLHQQYGVNKKHPSHKLPVSSSSQQQQQFPRHLAFAHVQGERYVDEENPHNKDKSFMTSMRSYSVIPTEEFRQRHTQKRHAKFFHRDIYGHDQQAQQSSGSAAGSRHRRGLAASVGSLRGSVSSTGAGATQTQAPPTAPKPFPEHLRNRIRGYSPPTYTDEQRFQQGDIDDEYEHGHFERKLEPSTLSTKLSLLKTLLHRKPHPDGDTHGEDRFMGHTHNPEEDGEEGHYASYPEDHLDHYDDQHDEQGYYHTDQLAGSDSPQRTQQHVQNLLHHFRQHVQPTLQSSQTHHHNHSPYDQGHYHQMQQSSHPPSNSRQPTMPQPLPDAVHLMKPTKSFSERLQQVPVLTNAQHRDLMAGIPMGLRDYSDHETQGHDPEELHSDDPDDHRSSIVQHPYPFRPMAKDINRPNDPNSIRSPKKPAFLTVSTHDGDIQDGDNHLQSDSIWSSRSRSRSGSPNSRSGRSRSPMSRSRSVSRSRSPTSQASVHSSHSGSGNYARPTRAYEIAQSEKAESQAQAQQLRESEKAKLTPVRMANSAQKGAMPQTDGDSSKSANNNSNNNNNVYRRRLNSRLAGDMDKSKTHVSPQVDRRVSSSQTGNNKNETANTVPPPVPPTATTGVSPPVTSAPISSTDSGLEPSRSVRGSISLDSRPMLLTDTLPAETTATTAPVTASATTSTSLPAVPNTVPVKLTVSSSKEKRRKKSKKSASNTPDSPVTTPTSLSSINTSHKVEGPVSSLAPAATAPNNTYDEANSSARPTKERFAEAFQMASQEAAQKISSDTKYAINFHNSDDELDEVHQPQPHNRDKESTGMNNGSAVNLWADRLVAAGYPANFYHQHSPRRRQLQQQPGQVDQEEEEDDDDGHMRYLDYAPPSHAEQQQQQQQEGEEDQSNPQYFFHGGATQQTNPEDTSGGVAGRIPLIRRRSSMTNQDESIRILTQGFIAIKHGRNGKPKEKIVRYNMEEQAIQWAAIPAKARRASLKKKASLSSFFFSSAQTDATEDTATDSWTQGLNNNNTLPETVIDEIKDVDWSCLYVDEVYAVKRGVQTEVLAKAGLLDPNCCLSLVTDERTLDLQFPNVQERNKVFRGMKALFAARDDVVYR